jgi:uncharacterized protein YaiE (UPF0345 family)
MKNMPSLSQSLLVPLLLLSASHFSSTAAAQTVGPITFDTAAVAGSFGSTYNFSGGGGSNTVAVGTNGYAASASGNQALLYDTTPGTYTAIDSFNGVVTVTMLHSSKTTNNSIGVTFFDTTTFTTAGDTTVDAIGGLFTIDVGTSSTTDIFRFYRDGSGGNAMLGTQLTNSANFSGSGGAFVAGAPATGSTAANSYAGESGLNVSADGVETFQTLTFVYNSNTSTITGTLGSISATYLIDVADRLTGNLGVALSFRGAGVRIDDLGITGSAIPEPSTYAAVAGLAVLGFVAVRRRRGAR